MDREDPCPTEDIREEAQLYIDALKRHSGDRARTMLQLGCGAGGRDFHFKEHFDVLLTDHLRFGSTTISSIHKRAMADRGLLQDTETEPEGQDLYRSEREHPCPVPSRFFL
jgi:hypothetical protein